MTENTPNTGIPPQYDDYDIVCPHPECPKGFYNRHDEHAVSTLVSHLNRDHEALYQAIRTKLGTDS